MYILISNYVCTLLVSNNWVFEVLALLKTSHALYCTKSVEISKAIAISSLANVTTGIIRILVFGKCESIFLLIEYMFDTIMYLYTLVYINHTVYSTWTFWCKRICIWIKFGSLNRHRLSSLLSRLYVYSLNSFHY